MPFRADLVSLIVGGGLLGAIYKFVLGWGIWSISWIDLSVSVVASRPIRLAHGRWENSGRKS